MSYQQPVERARTTCVYCGERISGSLRNGTFPAAVRRAARVACERHRYLVPLDPRFGAAIGSDE